MATVLQEGERLDFACVIMCWECERQLLKSSLLSERAHGNIPERCWSAVLIWIQKQKTKTNDREDRGGRRTCEFVLSLERSHI